MAGLAGSAPSVALATISLTVLKEGRAFATVEARSMIIGALAFFAYAYFVSKVLIRKKISASLASAVCLAIWFCAAGALWYITRM